MKDRLRSGKVVCCSTRLCGLSLLTVLAGAAGFTDIARCGAKKNRSIATVSPVRGWCATPRYARRAGAFQRYFVNWAAALTKWRAERRQAPAE